MLGYLFAFIAGLFLGGAVVERRNLRISEKERETHRAEVRRLRAQIERLTDDSEPLFLDERGQP